MNNLGYCTHKREHNYENDELYSVNKFKENSRTGKTRKKHYCYKMRMMKRHCQQLLTILDLLLSIKEKNREKQHSNNRNKKGPTTYTQ